MDFYKKESYKHLTMCTLTANGFPSGISRQTVVQKILNHLYNKTIFILSEDQV